LQEALVKTDSILITPERLALIAEIDEFKGAWRALRFETAPLKLPIARVANHCKNRTKSRNDHGRA